LVVEKKPESKIQAYKANKIIYLGDARKVNRVDPLTLNQLKIAMYSAAHVGPDDDERTRYKMIFVEFAKLCGFDEDSEGGKDYKRVFDEAKKLLKLGLEFTDSDGSLIAFNWLTSVKVTPGKGELIYSLSGELLPFYKTRQGSFSVISLLDYMPLKSKYSLMLFEFLSKWKNAGQVYQTVSQLREQLQVPNGKYKLTADFFNVVINPAIAEINKKTTVSFAVEKVEKRGVRDKIEGVTFVITPVGAAVQPISRDMVNLIDLLKASGVSAPMAKSLVGTYSRARILGNIATAKKLSAAGQIKKSLAAAICAAIRDDYAVVEPVKVVAVVTPVVVADSPAAGGGGEQETCAKCGGRGIFRDDSITTGSPFVVCTCKIFKKPAPVPYSKAPDPEPPDPEDPEDPDQEDPDAPWAVQGVAAQIAKALAARMQ